jgi:hypothetical protein
MPTVLSVTMAVGARQLAKKQAIVTRIAQCQFEQQHAQRLGDAVDRKNLGETVGVLDGLCQLCRLLMRVIKALWEVSST